MLHRPVISRRTCWLTLIAVSGQRFAIEAVAIIAALGFAAACPAADFDPFAGPKPTFVVVQSDPWGTVVDADLPRVSVYESGQVIFIKQIDGRGFYYHRTLDKQEFDKLQEQIKPVLAVKDFKRSYNIAPNLTDQPKSMFYFRDGDREVVTAVYGLMAAGTRLPAYTIFPGESKPDVLPSELLKLHTWLCKLDYADSKPWLPKYIEVVFWDYPNAPDPSIVWPKDWPGLDSDRAIKRGDLYSVYIDGKMVQKITDFLATRKERGAVEIGGKKMSATWRFVFPGEPIWRKALIRTQP